MRIFLKVSCVKMVQNNDVPFHQCLCIGPLSKCYPYLYVALEFHLFTWKPTNTQNGMREYINMSNPTNIYQKEESIFRGLPILDGHYDYVSLISQQDRGVASSKSLSRKESWNFSHQIYLPPLKNDNTDLTYLFWDELITPSPANPSTIRLKSLKGCVACLSFYFSQCFFSFAYVTFLFLIYLQ